MDRPSYDTYPSDEHVRYDLHAAESFARAGDMQMMNLLRTNARFAAELCARVEGRAFMKLPDYWFTYAGDASNRAGYPTRASFLWPKHQRLNQEAKARERALQEAKARERQIAPPKPEPEDIAF